MGCNGTILFLGLMVVVVVGLVWCQPCQQSAAPTAAVRMQLGAVHDVSSPDQLNAAVKGGEPVLAMFHSHGCGHCLRMKPVVEELAKTSDVPIVRMAVSPETQAWFAEQKFRGVPVFRGYKGGKTQDWVGARDEAGLKQLLAEVKAM